MQGPGLLRMKRQQMGMERGGGGLTGPSAFPAMT